MTARVLLVDDSRVNIRLLSARLTAEYYQVLEAENGFDALASAYIWQPDLILLDIMMPDMDGYECCALLKAEKATANIPVVMITALNEPEQRYRGLAAGADDFLTKPVDYDIFGARIKSLIGFRRLLLDWQVQSTELTTDAVLRDASVAPPPVTGPVLLRGGCVEATALRNHLRDEGISTVLAGTDQELICLAAVLEASICIIDLHLEGSDPLRLISVLRASDMTRDLPILTITARSRKNQILAAFSLGATDCLFEPIDAYEMRLRVRSQLKRSFFRIHVKSGFDKAVRAALVDPLTGAYNRLYLRRFREALLNNPVRVAVLMVDVDYFKKINDELGHIYGDRVLTQLVETLKRHVRGDDTVIRFGGEEFLVVMRDAGLVEARRIAERLRSAVENLAILTAPATGSPHLTISIGIAGSTEDGCDLENLITKADTALYRAKQNGRNRIECAQASYESAA
jgi:two-component system cell cycle response regulator